MQQGYTNMMKQGEEPCSEDPVDVVSFLEQGQGLIGGPMLVAIHHFSGVPFK